MAVIDTTQPADIRAFMGASGTGKSYAAEKEMRKAKRVLVWDIEHEFGLPIIPLAELPRFLHTHKTFKVCVVGSGDKKRRDAEFDLFCKIAFHTGNLLVVAEELRFVTEPSRAPEGWAMLSLRGRKRGVKIVGTSQRPASIDKDFLGQATYIRCGALNYPNDRKAVAETIGCTVEQIAALEGYEAIEWTRTPRKLIVPKRLQAA